MIDLAHDVRHSLRALSRRPTFTAVAVTVLALGIGANTAIFSLVHALLLRPVVAAEPERMVNLHSVSADGSGFHAFSTLDFLDYRDANPVLDLAAWSQAGVSLSTGDEPRMAIGQIVSSNYFDVFGVAPVAGRFFGTTDQPGTDAEPVAVIGHALGQAFGGAAGAAGAIGRTIHVNQQPVTVVGVAPEGFTGPFGGVATEVWVPLAMQPQIKPGVRMDARDYRWLEMVGRLAPGIDRPAAEAWLTTRADQVLAQRPETDDVGVELGEVGVIPGQVRGAAAGFLGVLMGVVGVLLLVTSVNVAGMLLARAVERRREIAVRLAIGAGRGRLIRQLVTESLLLFIFGGACGVLLAHWATGLVTRIELPIPAALALDLGVDLPVLGFTLATTLVVGIAFGLAPAMQATRVDLVSSLKADAGHGGRGRLRGRRAFVTVQVAGVLVLLVVAGSFVRSLSHATDIDPGFEVANLHQVSIDLGLHGYSDEAGRAFYDALIDDLARRPGIDSVSMARMVPLGMGNSTGGVEIPGAPRSDGEAYVVDTNTVGAGYFRTLGIPLVAGRGFDSRDHAASESVAVVNAELADRFWPAGDAVGRTVRFNGVERTIVGIAATGRYRTLGEAPRLFVYTPFAQGYSARMTVLARGTSGILGTLREAIRGLDRHLPVHSLQPVASTVDLSLLPQRVASISSGAFGLLGLALVAIGIYGVTAFTVTRRGRELGLRRALGATRASILRLIVGEGLRTAMTGVGLGLAVSFVAVRLLDRFLYGAGTDLPIVLLGAPVVLCVIVAVGCWVPALRATSIDPLRALRDE